MGRAASQFDPLCAFTPERKGCLTIVISVTRSAASISASGALRSVMITCFISAWAATNFQHFVHRHIVIAQHDVQFIGQHHVIAGVAIIRLTSSHAVRVTAMSRARSCVFPVKSSPIGLNSTLSGKRSEEHTSELQSLMRISYAVYCLEKHTGYPHIHKH